jgi:hypothetical protein
VDAESTSKMLLCVSMAAALGGGLYESFVLIPLWSKAPPSSFVIIQLGTGVPLQRFWLPVHVAITLCIIVALVMTWGEPTVRRLLLVALVSDLVMRVWSGLFFIPEMLAFQQVPLDEAPSAALAARVARWTFGHGGENLWTSSPLCVLCWQCIGSSDAPEGSDALRLGAPQSR